MTFNFTPPRLAEVRGVSVFAVDPGETTGWAWLCIGTKELRRLGLIEAMKVARDEGRFRAGQVDTKWKEGSKISLSSAEIEHTLRLYRLMEQSAVASERLSGGVIAGLTTLVIEDFLLRERTIDRTLLSPVRISAFVEMVVYQSTFIDPYIQKFQAANAKSIVTNARLKDWGLKQKGTVAQTKHAHDAIRHLVLYMRTLLGIRYADAG